VVLGRWSSPRTARMKVVALSVFGKARRRSSGAAGPWRTSHIRSARRSAGLRRGRRSTFEVDEQGPGNLDGPRRRSRKGPVYVPLGRAIRLLAGELTRLTSMGDVWARKPTTEGLLEERADYGDPLSRSASAEFVVTAAGGCSCYKRGGRRPWPVGRRRDLYTATAEKPPGVGFRRATE